MSTIDGRTLNRTRLRRQWLTQPRAATPVQAMEHLVGLQAQQSVPPYYQLWSRLAKFTPDDLSAALWDRSAVRVVLMRGTIHLVSAADAVTLRPIVQPYLDRTLFNGSQSGRRIAAISVSELVAEGHRLLAEAPMPQNQLASALAQRFGEFAGIDLAYGLRGAMPLIQTPPRGVWGQGGELVYASTRQWLGHEMVAEPDLADAIRRYLTAYGPATVQDFQAWSSLTKTATTFEKLRPELVVYRDTAGGELFDVPGAELSDPNEPLEPIMLGAFDNILLSHRDRTFVISKAAQKKVFTQNGIIQGTVLVDGFVAGTWKATMKKKSARVEVEPFEALTSTVEQQIEQRARRLLNFAAVEVDSGSVDFI